MMRRKLNAGAMPESEEKKLLAKLELADKCPYHDVLPLVFGPGYVKSILPPDLEEYVLYNIEMFWYPRVQQFLETRFPDVLLLGCNQWTCFCPKCAKKRPPSEKHNRFGHGFSSQYSWQAALNGWNSACARACKRMIINSLKGKMEFSESGSHSKLASQIHR